MDLFLILGIIFLFVAVMIFSWGESVGWKERGRPRKPAQLPKGKIWRCVGGFTGPRLVILSNVQNEKEYYLVDLGDKTVLAPTRAYEAQNNRLVVCQNISEIQSASL